MKAKNPRGWLSMYDWIAWANGVWHDIQEIDVLGGQHPPNVAKARRMVDENVRPAERTLHDYAEDSA
jgi:hypothetical protein